MESVHRTHDKGQAYNKIASLNRNIENKALLNVRTCLEFDEYRSAMHDWLLGMTNDNPAGHSPVRIICWRGVMGEKFEFLSRDDSKLFVSASTSTSRLGAGIGAAHGCPTAHGGWCGHGCSPTPLMAQNSMPCLMEVQKANPMVMVPHMKQPIAVTVILS